MLRLTLALCSLVPAAAAQFRYDFNQLNGSDTHPYTLLHGQDGWSEQTFNAANRCGVTATLSHDGSRSLRFQEVGPGYGCDASRINDGAWFFPPFAGGEANASFQCDMLVGYWGGSFGLGHDTNSNGQLRRGEAGELGVRFTVGTQANVQLQLVPASGAAVRVPLSSAVPVAGNQWLRVRVVMDLAAAGGAGLGSVWVMNLTTGGTALVPVPGLQDIPLGLNQAATDATNPRRWDAMWLHFEGATYGLDNIEVGRAGFGRPYGAGCQGTFGPVTLTAQGTFQPGSPLQLVSGNHTAGQLGVAIFGYSNTSHLGQPLPYLLDPQFGTSGCSLLASIDVTLLAVTGSGSPASLVTPLTVPNGWTGHRFFVQHACFEPVAGGMSWSNGLLLQLP